MGCVQVTHLLFYRNTRPFTETHFLWDALVTNKPPLQFRTSTQSKGALNMHLCPRLTYLTSQISKTRKAHIPQKPSTKLPVPPPMEIPSQRMTFIMLLHRNQQAAFTEHDQEEKRTQSPPSMLRLVNNYLGGISCVFCASWLASE